MQATAARRLLGDFELMEEIGRGGMGIVFRAERVADGRVVAVKVLPPGVALDTDAVERFAREAEAAARLSHPGILPILAMGEDEGVHYFATDLIEGPNLEAVLAELRTRDVRLLSRSIADETTLGVACPGVRARAGTTGDSYASSCAVIAADVASALAAAHASHLIHRDVKPGNVLIDPSGQPLLVDFGLSRDEAAAGLTRSGDAVGTPAYMAPEQASGRRDVDARVDVWGLGATLYEMLTLQPPFAGSHPGQIMRRILDDDAVPVRVHNPAVPAALANIVEMCLRKDRSERYVDAAALECDLRTYLSGGKVVARPLGLLRRLRDRWRAYVRPAVMAVSLASVVVAALLGGSAWWRQSALRQGQAQLAEAARAVLALDVAAAEAAYASAEDLVGSEHVSRARVEHLEAAVPPEPEGEHSSAVFSTLLDSVPVQRRGPRTLALRARLEGTGVVRLIDSEREARVVTLRQLRKGKTVESRFPHDGVLLPGSYTLEAATPRGAVVRAWFEVQRGGTVTVAIPSLPPGTVGTVLTAAGPGGPMAVAVRETPWHPAPGEDPQRAARAEAARTGTHVLSPRLVELAIAAGALPAPSQPDGDPVDARPTWLARFLSMPDAAWAAECVAAEARLAVAAASGERVVDWALLATGEVRAADDGGTEPGAQLHGEGDAYVLRLPLSAPGVRMVTRLTLPPGTGIDDVEPAPTRHYWQSGRLSMLWEPGRAKAAFVRFRCDGGLGGPPPSGSEIHAAIARDAYRLAERDALAHWCDPAWAGASRVAPSLALPTVIVRDVIEVAGEVTVDFTVDLEDVGSTAIRAWPLRARWRAGSPLVLTPAIRADTGTLQAGRYHHAGLRVRLDAHGRADRVLRRAHAHASEAQVEVLRVGPNGEFDSRVGAVLLATRVCPGEDEAGVMARLSDGASVSGGARAVTGEERDFVGQGERVAPAVAREWSVDPGDGRGVRRERWVTAAVADRRVLIRLFAVGATHRAAEDALRDAHRWLTDVVKAVVIE